MVQYVLPEPIGGLETITFQNTTRTVEVIDAAGVVVAVLNPFEIGKFEVRQPRWWRPWEPAKWVVADRHSGVTSTATA